MKTQPYTVRRSKRAKNLILQVTRAGQIEVVLPWRVARREAERFVQEKENWLAKTRAQVQEREKQRVKRRLVSGEMVPVLGRQYRLRVVVDPWRHRAGCGEEAGEVSVFIRRPQDARRVLTQWYCREAQHFFTKQVKEFAYQLKVRPGKVVVSHARSQWGSCMPKTRRISLNWRLLLGPAAVARYVAAHEVAHLKERKHTAMFWQQVAFLDANYEEQVAWLKRWGESLQL